MLTADDPSSTTFCITRNISNLEDNIHHKRAAKFIDLVSSSASSPIASSLPSPKPKLQRFSTGSQTSPTALQSTAALDAPRRYVSTSDSVLASCGVEQSFTTVLNLPAMTPPAPNRSPKTISKAVLYTISTPGIKSRARLLLENINGSALSPSSPPPAPIMEIDRDAQKMLAELRRDKIHHVLAPENMAHFDIEWTNPEECNPSENMEYLERFKETFEAQMLRPIERAVKKQQSITRNSHVVEILQHLTMCRQRSQVPLTNS